MKRNLIFDRNRLLSEMEQEIQRLQQALQQMQQQHRTEMAQLQQQLIRPERVFELSADQVLKKFNHIKPFYGKQEDSLQEFLNAVENVASLCGENANLLQFGLQIVFKEKIQGEAKLAIQRLGADLTWEAVKAELKLHFRPRKTYKRLMDEARNIKVSSLRDLFNIVRGINFQLNELYEYDENKPCNYNPQNNDRNLVDIVKDMVNGCYRVNIRNNMSLIEVVNLFDSLGLLDEGDAIHPNFRKNFKDPRQNHFNNRRDHNDHKPNKPQFNSHKGNHYNNFPMNGNNPGQQKQFHNKNVHNNGSGQFRNNGNKFPPNNNNSGQYRNNFRQNFNNNSGQFRQYPQNNNPVEPMEVDNIQWQDINFSDEPRTENSQ